MTILWTDGDGGSRGKSTTIILPKPSSTLGDWLDNGKGVWLPGRTERIAFLPDGPVPCRCQSRILEVEALEAGAIRRAYEDVFAFSERVYTIPIDVMSAAIRANDHLDHDDDLLLFDRLSILSTMRPETVENLRSLQHKYLGRVIEVYEAAGL